MSLYFKSSQAALNKIDLRPPKQSEQLKRFPLKSLMILFGTCCAVVLAILDMITPPTNFESIFVALYTVSVYLLTVVFNQIKISSNIQELFQLIEDLENLANEREFQRKTNAN